MYGFNLTEKWYEGPSAQGCVSEIYYVSLLNYVRQCCQTRWRDLEFLQPFEIKENNSLFNSNNLIIINLFFKVRK